MVFDFRKFLLCNVNLLTTGHGLTFMPTAVSHGTNPIGIPFSWTKPAFPAFRRSEQKQVTPTRGPTS